MASSIDVVAYVKKGVKRFQDNAKELLPVGATSLLWSIPLYFFWPGSFITFGVLLAGMIIVVMDIMEGEEADPKEMMEALKNFIPFFTVGILMELFIMLGSVVFIVGGVVVAGWYLFAMFFTLDREMGVMEALEESRKYAFDRQQDIAIFAAILFFINIVGFAPHIMNMLAATGLVDDPSILLILIGALSFVVTAPLTVCILAEAYHDLFGFQAIEVTDKPKPKPAPPKENEGA